MIYAQYKSFEYAIDRAPGEHGSCGLRWFIRRTQLPGMRPDREDMSSGAFYNDCSDHPEGAHIWAETSARKRIDILMGYLT